jgi:hypothetical protein
LCQDPPDQGSADSELGGELWLRAEAVAWAKMLRNALAQEMLELYRA